MNFLRKLALFSVCALPVTSTSSAVIVTGWNFFDLKHPQITRNIPSSLASLIGGALLATESPLGGCLGVCLIAGGTITRDATWAGSITKSLFEVGGALALAACIRDWKKTSRREKIALLGAAAFFIGVRFIIWREQHMRHYHQENGEWQEADVISC